MDTVISDDIKKKLLKLFKDKMSYDFNENNMYLHFLSSKIGMRPRHLLYLYFFIEEEFNITISQDYIISGEFSTFRNVCTIIQKEFNKSSIK